MIRAHIVGELATDPEQRISKRGRTFALVHLYVWHGDPQRVSCRLITFEAEAIKTLMQMRRRKWLSATGLLKADIFTARSGTVRPLIHVTAHQIADAPKPIPSTVADHPFGDLAGDGGAE